MKRLPFIFLKSTFDKFLFALFLLAILLGIWINISHAETFGNYVSCTVTSGNVLANAESEDATFTCTAVTNSYCPADLGCTNGAPGRISIMPSASSTYTGSATKEILTAKACTCSTGVWTFTVKARDRESVAECTGAGTPYACCTGVGAGATCQQVHSGDWGEGSKVNMVSTAGQAATWEAGIADITDWTAHNSYPAACSAGQFVTTMGDTNTCSAPSWTGTVIFIIDGSGSAISTGQKGHIEVPFACTIIGWTILGDQSGSIVVDLWKDTYANFPPTVADTVAGSEKPSLSSAQKNQDLSLSTWTTSVTAGDILAYNVDSASTVTRVTISLRYTR